MNKYLISHNTIKQERERIEKWQAFIGFVILFGGTVIIGLTG